VDKWGLEVSRDLFFKRVEGGVQVTVYKDGVLKPPQTFMIDSAVWAYAVAYVSRLGPLSPMIEAAKMLHEGSE
jgi:hypothetical protein